MPISVWCVWGRVAALGTSDLTRVGYRLREGRLGLLLKPALDLPPRTGPSVHILLSDIKAFGRWPS